MNTSSPVSVRGKRCVVTGAAGFVGKHMCALLVREGSSVVAVDTQPLLQEGVESVTLDICNKEALVEVLNGAAYVFHLAARVSVPESIEKPTEYFETNVMGTLAVLEAARIQPVPPKVVLASSAAVYGDQTEMRAVETLTPYPKSQYAETKLMTERMAALWYTLYGLSTVSIRPFNIYGEGMSSEGAYASAVGIFLARMREGKPILITGDGEQTRDYVHVADVVRGYLAAATSPRVGHGEVINIASGVRATMNSVAALVGGVVEHTAPRPGDIRHSCADISRAQELLGFEPQVTLTAGIEQLRNIT
jgi:UDP-glucose 4-epimerase